MADADVYCLNIVEMVSKDKNIRVFFIPCPILGPKSFFREIGSLLRASDVMLLEQTALDSTHRQPAVSFLPMKRPFSEWLKLDHRFYDILSTNEEPPMLLPTTAGSTWFGLLKEIANPYPMRILLNPIGSASSKGDSRVGWGWLLDSLDMIRDMQVPSGPMTASDANNNNTSNTASGDDGDEVTHGVIAHLPESRVARPASNWGNVHPVNMKDEGNAGAAGVSKGQRVNAASAAAAAASSGENTQRTVAVPWSVNQIVNLEASLLREGYDLVSVTPVRWVERGWFGNNYADAAGL